MSAGCNKAFACLSIIVLLLHNCSICGAHAADAIVNARPPSSAMIKANQADLAAVLSSVEPGLASVLSAIADSVTTIAEALRSVDFDYAGSTNSFGDNQLQADLHADEVIFSALRGTPQVASASSEEQTDIIPLNPGGEYSVAFDPLDGSSIVDANFAVGSIFGIWRGATPLGQTGRQQVAAAYSVYGPKTLLVLALPSSNTSSSGACRSSSSSPAGAEACSTSAAAGGAEEVPEVWDTHEVQQFSWTQGRWVLREPHVQIRAKSIVAPANLKAAGDNPAYKQLIDSWIAGGYKLRYSGGMVPDVHHILAKGGGVFCNPVSRTAPAKLRLLYECAPLALVMEAAGGLSSNGTTSILDLPITNSAMTSSVVLGSRQQVATCLPALAAGTSASSSPLKDTAQPAPPPAAAVAAAVAGLQVA